MSGVEQKRFENARARRTGRLWRHGAGMRTRRAMTLHRKTCPERERQEEADKNEPDKNEPEPRFHFSFYLILLYHTTISLH